jgi:hypothetical protein
MRFLALAMVANFLFAGIALADEDTKDLVASVRSLTTAVEKRHGEWWKPLLGPVAGGLMGFGISMLTLLIVHFRSRWNRPVLEGVVDATRGGLVTVQQEMQGGGTRDVKHVRLTIRNTGKEAARKCRVVLIGIKKLVDNGWTDLDYHDAVELIWAYGWAEKLVDRVIEKDIVRGINYFVDICNANSHDNHLNLALVQVSPRYRDLIDPEGSYVFTMLIAAENADTNTVSLRVTWPKRAANLTIEVGHI